MGYKKFKQARLAGIAIMSDSSLDEAHPNQGISGTEFPDYVVLHPGSEVSSPLI